MLPFERTKPELVRLFSAWIMFPDIVPFMVMFFWKITAPEKLELPVPILSVVPEMVPMTSSAIPLSGVTAPIVWFGLITTEPDVNRLRNRRSP
jgi:hypothetical protein